MKYLTILFLFFISTGALYSQKPKKLFRSDSIIELTIRLPLKDVINNRKDRKEYESTMSYNNADGTAFNHAIKVQVRGKTRALKQICSFPPLQLRFNKKDTENSIFKGQKKLKLVTHCQNDKAYEEYIQREYVVYKMYQKISPYSFNVRLCRINYINENKPSQKNIYFGFLIESTKHVAKRNDMTVFKGKIRNQEVVDKDNLDKLLLFQFMIGNLDWGFSTRHNIKFIIGEKGELPRAIPYDFDYCGMVNTPYAVPPEELELPDVKTRLFRGFCRRNNYQKTIEFYKNMEKELHDEVNRANFLTAKSRDNMNKYIDSFYEILNSDKYAEKKIMKACKVNHKHAYEYDQ